MDSPDDLPHWVDAELSATLGRIVAAGETQSVEFKAQFPKQASDLGKEVAAFATTNAGTIILGIGDDGVVIGLDDAQNLAGRQALVARVEGLCAGGVKPSVTPILRFGLIDSRAVLSIDVPKGSAPVYYSANIPYLRQLTAARPMTPDEVVEAVLAWDQERRGAAEPSAGSLYLGELVNLLVDVIVRASEIEVREYGDGLQETRYYLASFARQLRDLASRAPTECADTVGPISTLAQQVDIAAHEELTLNSGFAEMNEAARSAVSQARKIASEFLKPEFFNPATRAGLDENLAMIVRQQDTLTGRIDALIDGYRMDELRSDAGNAGLNLRKVGAFLSILGEHQLGERLDGIGARLREIEVREIYMDGGRSQQSIIDDLRSANTDLQALAAT